MRLPLKGVIENDKRLCGINLAIQLYELCKILLLTPNSCNPDAEDIKFTLTVTSNHFRKFQNTGH